MIDLRRFGPAVLLATAFAALGGCYEREQRGTLNPDGSGKVVIDTEAAVPTMGEPGKEKPTAVTLGRALAANLINSTRGVEAWSDVKIDEAPGSNGTRSKVTITAYFPDIRKLRFDLPVTFVWKPGENGTTLFGVERTKSPTNRAAGLSDAEVKKAVADAQTQYKEQQPALKTALSVFKLTMRYTLPGEVTESRVFAREGNTVALTLEGPKVVEAIDKFMADEAAVTATIKSGSDLADNDDLLLQSMYGQKGPVMAAFKAGGKPAFDYSTEAKSALAGEAKMLETAGVELVPRVTIKGVPSK